MTRSRSAVVAIAVAAPILIVVVAATVAAWYFVLYRNRPPQQLDAMSPEEMAARAAEPAVQWVLKVGLDGVPSGRRDEVMAATLDTLARRMKGLGVARAILARARGDADHVLVQLPAAGVDPDRLRTFLTQVGLVELRLVERGPEASREALAQATGGGVPDGCEVLTGFEPQIGGGTAVRYYLVRQAPVVTGRDLRTASVSKDESGQPAVRFSLSPGAAQVFSEYTAAHIGSQLAIVFDGRIQSAPRIDSRIGGEGQIQGRFTVREAEDVAMLLRSGALPAAVVVLQERAVGPRR
jgi:preprotein translocase subunit SecD